jgi:hypothetical protein
MARVIANPFGEMRGKFAGMVFSRNASGQMIRAYVIPANANSNAQVQSRAKFRAASQAYKNLTKSQKSDWDTFAKLGFTPQTKINIGQYTAAQAFTAIRTGAINAQAKTFAGTWMLDGTTTIAEVCSVFDSVEDAPIQSVTPEIKQNANPPATMELSGITVTQAGVVEFQIDFIGVPVGGLDADNFVDSNDIKFSFGAYLSDVVSSEGNRPRNDLFQSLGNPCINTFAGVTLDSGEFVTVTWDFSTLITGFKSWPGVGKIAKLTVFVIGKSGTMAKLGDGYVTIS